MSFQEQQQQPSLTYPNTGVASSQTPTTTSHSNGSFGAVFIVLAVIVVVSAIACFLSRLCSRRLNHHNHRKGPKQSHGPPMPRPEKMEPKQGHHGNFQDRDLGDIEFGFGKGFPPNGKQFGNGGEMGRGPKGGKPHVRFDFRGEPRVGDERELKRGEFGAI